MKRWDYRRLSVALLASLLLWAIVAIACMCIGSNGRLGWPHDPDTQAFRFRVVGVASIVGARIASAGVAYQAILRNPLADPYLLGVSSGATLSSFLWRLPTFAVLTGPALLALGQQGCAFVGALLAVAVVLALAGRRGRIDPVTLLLVGVIVNSINGALFLLINALEPQLLAATGGMLSFLVGGIQTNLADSEIVAAGICAAVGWIVLLFISGQLNAAMLGDAESQALGISIHRLRWIALIAASIITAAAVAVSGPIGFVGLICPHLARLVVGNDQRRLLPIATAIGASLLALSDAATRILSSSQLGQTMLPVGVLTALLGGPFFLFLLFRERRGVGV